MKNFTKNRNLGINKSMFILILNVFIFSSISFSQCHCDRTAVGGACTPMANCGVPQRNACIASGGIPLLPHTPCATPLPVILTEYNLDHNENSVFISWKTATERDNDYFTIQNSKDGLNWTEIGILKGSGNSTSENVYNFEDTNPYVGKSYYRVYQTDFNGELNEVFKTVTEYSNSKYLFYPIPVNKLLFVEGRSLGVSQINVYNSVGEKVNVNYNIENEKIDFDFSEIKNGAYFVSIQNEETKHTERIIVFHK